MAELLLFCIWVEVEVNLFRTTLVEVKSKLEYKVEVEDTLYCNTNNNEKDK